MAGMQFEYDEEGGTFFYFLLSFWALGLFPATYFCWPRAKASGTRDSRVVLCGRLMQMVVGRLCSYSLALSSPMYTVYPAVQTVQYMYFISYTLRVFKGCCLIY